jgi:hypothetical protein
MSLRRPVGSRIVAVAATLAIALSLPAAGVARPSATPASYPSCGSYWNRNNPVTAMQRRVNACIAKAASDGRRARAVAVYTTVEGDPIANYVFVRGPRDVLVVTDGTRDRFGSGKWSRERCTAVTASRGFLGWTGCRPVGTGKPPWLVPYRLAR